MARIDYTEQSDADLGGIWSYIADNSSASIADAVLARIFGALEALSFAPLIGRVRADLNGKPRSFPVRPYTIIYEPLPHNDGIVVWRVLHGARDLKRIVKRPKGKS
jgi:plasmid stabilization system protein ParE